VERDELAGWLRLTLTPGIGNTAARRLLAAFGLPSEVFAQPAAALRQIVPEAQANALLQPPDELGALLDRTSNGFRASSRRARRTASSRWGTPPIRPLCSRWPIRR
jgi:DNA processing protein